LQKEKFIPEVEIHSLLEFMNSGRSSKDKSSTFSEFLQFTLKEYQIDLRKIKKKHSNTLRVVEKNKKDREHKERDNWEMEYSQVVEEFNKRNNNTLLDSQNDIYEEFNFKNPTRKNKVMVYWKNAKKKKK
jgi:hypothetical protein